MSDKEAKREKEKERKARLKESEQLRAGQGNLFNGFMEEGIREMHARNTPPPHRTWSRLEFSLDREGNDMHLWISMKEGSGGRRERYCTVHASNLSVALLALLDEVCDMYPRGDMRGL